MSPEWNRALWFTRIGITRIGTLWEEEEDRTRVTLWCLAMRLNQVWTFTFSTAMDLSSADVAASQLLMVFSSLSKPQISQLPWYPPLSRCMLLKQRLPDQDARQYTDARRQCHDTYWGYSTHRQRQKASRAILSFLDMGFSCVFIKKQGFSIKP